MWIRRRAVAGMATATFSEPAPLSTSRSQGAAEEHPAKRRIRRANQLADAMRPSGGRHRRKD